MEDLILKDGEKSITVDSKFYGNMLYIEVDDRAYLTESTTGAKLTPSQTRELIAHLTNCLKEVENG